VRVLVTGASGFLGYHLSRYLAGKGVETLALWRSQKPDFTDVPSHQLDLAEKEKVRALVVDWAPTHVVHCAALTSTSACEAHPDRAYRDNFLATECLLEVANEALRRPPFFVYVSTDLVFDGMKGFYRETDPPAPIMVYGRTKRAAEEAVELTYRGEWAIVRSALIYGLPTALGRGAFLAWLLDDLAAGTCRLFSDEYRSPIAVHELCWLVDQILDNTKVGYWHAGGPERLSRFEIGQIVARCFGFPADAVQPALLAEALLPAPRPRDVSLDISRARSELGFAPRSFEENIRDLARVYPPIRKRQSGA
jgi:dTDP-4-dehydrorhamnose reductase